MKEFDAEIVLSRIIWSVWFNQGVIISIKGLSYVPCIKDNYPRAHDPKWT